MFSLPNREGQPQAGACFYICLVKKRITRLSNREGLRGFVSLKLCSIGSVESPMADAREVELGQQGTDADRCWTDPWCILVRCYQQSPCARRRNDISVWTSDDLRCISQGLWYPLAPHATHCNAKGMTGHNLPDPQRIVNACKAEPCTMVTMDSFTLISNHLNILNASQLGVFE